MQTISLMPSTLSLGSAVTYHAQVGSDISRVRPYMENYCRWQNRSCDDASNDWPGERLRRHLCNHVDPEEGRNGETGKW